MVAQIFIEEVQTNRMHPLQDGLSQNVTSSLENTLKQRNICQGGTGVAQLVARSTPDRCVVGSSPTRGTEHFGLPPLLRDWVIKGLGMSSLVYATGQIKDPVPLIERRWGLSPGGRFPPSFIHQVIIITGLNKLYGCMFSP